MFLANHGKAVSECWVIAVSWTSTHQAELLEGNELYFVPAEFIYLAVYNAELLHLACARTFGMLNSVLHILCVSSGNLKAQIGVVFKVVII